MKKRRLKKWVKYTMLYVYMYIIIHLMVESVLSNNYIYMFTACIIILITDLIMELKEMKEGKR